MKFVQTFWSCNKTNLLIDNFGWASPEYNLMGLALSCLLLKEHQESPHLLTDTVSAGILADELNLLYADIQCELDRLNGYQPDLWALPKIYTYSRQTHRFIHIDGDAFLWQPFCKEFLQKGGIAQNREKDTEYYRFVIENLKKHVAFMPAELTEEPAKAHFSHSYNAGIIGGNDLAFFQEYCWKAFEFVDGNQTSLYHIQVSSFNTIFEQYLFCRLRDIQGKEVHTYIQGDIMDLRYQGFAEFLDTPHSRKFLHLYGAYKTDETICRQMANRLRNDYPDYYYRIIFLFKKTEYSFKHDYYHFLKETTAENLISRFRSLQQDTFLPVAETPNSGTVMKDSYCQRRSRLCQQYLENTTRDARPDSSLAQTLLKDIFHLEDQVTSITDYIDEMDNILLEALQSARPINEVAETITGANEIADTEKIKFIESIVRQRIKRGIHRKPFKIDTSAQECIIA